MDDGFDIYSVTKFSFSESRFSRLRAVDPVLRLIENEPAVNDAGYLGLSLTQLESLWLVKVLRRMGIETYPVSERYKTTRVSVGEARQIADEFIMQARKRNPGYDYADVEEIQVSWWLSKIVYGFFSKSITMLRDGTSPAGITVCIDRVSGEVLQERQLVNLELAVTLTEE